MHSSSAYNRSPKGTKRELGYEARLALVRKNLSMQEERLHKLRMDRLQTKPMVEGDHHIKPIWVDQVI